MCDCIASTLPLLPISRSGVSRLSIHDSNLRFLRRLCYGRRDFYGFGSESIGLGFGRNVSGSKNPGGLGFEEVQFEEGLGVTGEVLSDLGIEKSRDELESCGDGDGFKELSDAINELASVGVEFLEQNGDGLNMKTWQRRKKGDAKKMKVDLRIEGKEGSLRSGRNVLKRSSLVAKQVISIQSAMSLGFVSQLWVDASIWRVQVVEVRASLLSGESERFLLKDVFQVGDVVLVRNDSVMDSETQLIGMETLVGYDVITTGKRRIGKVRGYSLDINSGAVESLELDSFGISIIPTSLVSTYVLLVEDVLEVLTDEIVVHEAAASRIQRLTKGIWGFRSAKTINKNRDFYDIDVDIDQSSLPLGQPRSRKKSSRQKYHQDISGKEDDWELPIDYL